MQYIVAINTIGRPVTLVMRAVLSGLNQTALQPYRVILLDQNQEKLLFPPEIASHPLFEHRKVEAKSVSLARNKLTIPPLCDWIIFCDDDGFLAPNYVSEFLKIIAENNQLDILAGSIKRDDNQQFYSIRHQKGGSLKYFWNTKLLMGSNFCVKVKTFETLARFDHEFGAGSRWGSGEETDFAWKAFFTQTPMEFFPQLVVYHVRPYAQSLSKDLEKAYQYGIGKGALVSKWIFTQKKLWPVMELIEMFLVPPMQIVRALLTFNFKLIPINIYAFWGRMQGIYFYLRNHL